MALAAVLPLRATLLCNTLQKQNHVITRRRVVRMPPILGEGRLPRRSPYPGAASAGLESLDQ